jgi:hypothetical protein
VKHSEVLGQRALSRLDRATRRVPADSAPGGSRLAESYLIANRVEGLESGAYQFDATRLLPFA